MDIFYELWTPINELGIYGVIYVLLVVAGLLWAVTHIRVVLGSFMVLTAIIGVVVLSTDIGRVIEDTERGAYHTVIVHVALFIAAIVVFYIGYRIQNEKRIKNGRASPSRVFPDYPLTPLNPNPAGTEMKGEYLANIGKVGLAICKEFRSAKKWMRGGWPQYADGELDALERAYLKMCSKAITRHSVNIALVRKLAREYIKRIRNTKEAHSKFMEATWTIWHLSIDFANTIGYGGGLDAALDWYQNSAWLDKR